MVHTRSSLGEKRKEQSNAIEKWLRSVCVVLISNTRKQLESVIIAIAPIVTFPPSARPDSNADHLFLRAK